MTRVHKVDRREFLRISGVAATGLVLGATLGCGEEEITATGETNAVFSPSVFLSLDREGSVTVVVARSEMGQGVRTALPMIVAEELEADWSRIRIEPALADEKYGDMSTGGSRSIRNGWMPLRKVGAAARTMLLAAAAEKWGVPRDECRAEQGDVIHAPTGRRLGYGELAEAASRLEVPEDVPLKSPEEFRIVGTPVHRLDTPSKVDGSARFGLDVRVPGMRVAVVDRCPVFGGKAKGFDASRAAKVPGVLRVVEIPEGIAVVAESTWAAMKGRERLNVDWDEGEGARLDDAAILEDFRKKSRGPVEIARDDGNVERSLAAAARRLEAEYVFPYLAHATMEPMNATARVGGGAAEVWAPTQSPQWLQRAVAKALGLPAGRVKVHTTLLGGGFGRRAFPEFGVEAARISAKIGAPVQVVWTREDDMRHDRYRPASFHRVTAGLDGKGRLVAWSHRIVAQSIVGQNFGVKPRGAKADLVDGAADLAYGILNLRVEYAAAELPVPVGWWRSVYNSQHPFVNECFVDEIAAATGKDPLAFRRELLPRGSRLRGVLELAARRAGWDAPPAPGRSRGIACHASFGSFVAHVAEVSVDDSLGVRVHRVVCAVDCGQVVNPDTIEAQMESAVVFGLSAVLRGRITLERGRVVQGNFDDYPPLRIEEMPEVEVAIAPSREDPGGIGEPGLPPLGPAVGNAVFAATGRPVHRLPLSLEAGVTA